MAVRDRLVDGVSTKRGDVVPLAARSESQPQDGDLVVVRVSGSDSPFSVHQVPGEAQFRAPTRNDAIQLARSFAQSHGVDLWYSDQTTCTLLERHRPRDGQVSDERKVGRDERF
jgi:hypothetical protein